MNDPMSSYYGLTPQPAAPVVPDETATGGLSVPWLVAIACCVCAVAAALWWWSRGTTTPPLPFGPLLGPPAPPPADAAPPAAPPATTAYDPDPLRIEARDPGAKLLTFAFESLQRPNFVPDMALTLVRKPAANPVYALVPCGVSNSRYAVRWQGKFLTVITGSVLEWSDTKREPNSCWAMVPGYCQKPGDEFVMLRSAHNGHFLRADAKTGKLQCSDSPTKNTAPAFCWRLRAPAAPTDASCGCQYDPVVRSVVCKPCSITSTAAPATAAPLPGPWPELVGWDVDQAYAFLSQRHPEVTAVRVSCPSPQTWCPVNAAAPRDRYVVALRFSPETGRVLFAPAVEVPGNMADTMPAPQQPLVVRV